jgi:hypothetical protein
MANLSRLEIIETKLIGGLNTFHDLFNSTCTTLGISSSLDALYQMSNKGDVYMPIASSLTPVGLKDILLDLILAL